MRIRKRSRCASGSGYTPSDSIGFWVASTRNGCGHLVGDAADRHLALGHDLEQRRLHLRGRAVDLVGEHEVREHRPELDVEPLGRRAVDAGADDVGRDEVGRELDAGERAAERLARASTPSASCRGRARLRAGSGRRRAARRAPARARAPGRRSHDAARRAPARGVRRLRRTPGRAGRGHPCRSSRTVSVFISTARHRTASTCSAIAFTSSRRHERVAGDLDEQVAVSDPREAVADLLGVVARRSSVGVAVQVVVARLRRAGRARPRSSRGHAGRAARSSDVLRHPSRSCVVAIWLRSCA